MKNLVYVVLLVAALAGCKKKDNGVAIKEESKPFIGTWIGYYDSRYNKDTITFGAGNFFSTKLYNGPESFEIISKDSVRFTFKNAIEGNSLTKTWGYELKEKVLVLKCWGITYSNGGAFPCFDYTFVKQ